MLYILKICVGFEKQKKFFHVLYVYTKWSKRIACFSKSQRIYAFKIRVVYSKSVVKGVCSEH